MTIPIEGDDLVKYNNLPAIPRLNPLGTVLNELYAGGVLANRVVIQEAADFNGVIDSTKEYFIDGVVDMTGVSLEVPAGGVNIKGYDFNISQLTCADNNYTMFTSPGGGSGDVLLQNVAFSVTGTNSKVVDLVAATGFEAWEINNVNFNSCTAIGALDGYRQGLETGTGRFGGTPSLEFKGAWSGGYRITASIVRSIDNAMADALFKAGAGFTMASRFLTDINVDLGTTAPLIDFAAANFPNPSTLQLHGVVVTRNGVFDPSDATISPNITAPELECDWAGNQGLPNTFEGATSAITAQTTTTISVIGTFYDLDGTWTLSNAQHFDSPANGHTRHLGNNPIEYMVQGTVIIEGPPNAEISVKLVKWDDSASAFVDVGVGDGQIINLRGGRDVAYIAAIAFVSLEQNDYLKLQVANNTSTGNLTAEIGSFYNVSVR